MVDHINRQFSLAGNSPSSPASGIWNREAEQKPSRSMTRAGQISINVSKLISCNKLGEALEAAEAALEKYPNSTSLLHQAANLHWRIKTPNYRETAIRYVQYALTIEHTDPRLLQLMGYFEEQSGRIQSAVDYYKYAAACDPNHPEFAISKLAKTLRKHNRLDEALRVVEETLKQKPDNKFLRAEQIQILRRQGETQKLYGAVMKALDEHPEDQIFLILAGRMGIERNDSDLVRQCTMKLLQAEPVHVTTLFFIRAAAIMGYFDKGFYQAVLNAAKDTKAISPPYDTLEWPADETDPEVLARNFLDCLDLEDDMHGISSSAVFRTMRIPRPIDRTAWDVSGYREQKMKWEPPAVDI
jgi:tetratricopeptide (TPR) repeat protein